MIRALAILILLAIGCLVAIVVLVSRSSAHTVAGMTYDNSCCHDRDCYPLPDGYSYHEQPDGNYHATWVSPLTGKIISGVVQRSSVKDTQDHLEHGCEREDGLPRCLYIHRGA